MPARELFVRLDPRSKKGLQQQIYASLREAILTGVVAPGARVPSSRELAQDLGVSRTTTLLAVEQLIAEGYLDTRRASGTFVAVQLPDDLERLAPAPRGPGRAAPRLSRRGRAVAGTPSGAARLAGPPRPFRVGTPAVDLLPLSTWSRLAHRRWRRLTATQMDYGDPAGQLPLREAIAGHVGASRGTECTADQVLVTAGAQQALDVACRFLLDPGDAAWIEEPGYPGARSTLVAAGARLVPVPVDAEGLDVEAGRRRAPRARLVYVTPSHQYPLGVPMTLGRRLALLRWASQAQAWVVEDDYDSEFRYGARPIPCLHGLDADGRVIYVGSFSKTLFPSLRLGFLIVPRALVGSLVLARAVADQSPPVLDQLTLADFIAEGHFARHLRRMRQTYRERLDALTEAVETHGRGLLRLRPTQTGLHVVADLDGIEDRRVSALAAERGIEAAPLSVYYAGRARRQNGLVLGFGAVRPAALTRGVETLMEAIAAARRR